MPDKHEVGGSSPLGPTKGQKTPEQLNIYEGDLVLSSSECNPKGEYRALCKGRESRREAKKLLRDISLLMSVVRVHLVLPITFFEKKVIKEASY